MPHFQLPINDINGAIITIFVGVSDARAVALKKASVLVPPPISVQGLVDTGASGLCIDPSIAKQLSLQPTGSVPMITPSTGTTPVNALLYDVSIKIPHAGNSLDFDSIPAIESDLINQGFGALIGRDILSKCLLIYDGISKI